MEMMPRTGRRTAAAIRTAKLQGFLRRSVGGRFMVLSLLGIVTQNLDRFFDEFREWHCAELVVAAE